jgi:hypothetical protein
MSFNVPTSTSSGVPLAVGNDLYSIVKREEGLVHIHSMGVKYT